MLTITLCGDVMGIGEVNLSFSDSLVEEVQICTYNQLLMKVITCGLLVASILPLLNNLGVIMCTIMLMALISTNNTS